MDIESIRKRVRWNAGHFKGHYRDIARKDTHRTNLQNVVDCIRDRGDLLSEVDRLTRELATRPSGNCTTPGCNDGPRMDGECWTCPRCVDQQQDAARAEAERLRGEYERLRVAGKDMIDAVLTGATIRDPITPTDIEAIEASKRFCALIGAELLREQKVENEQLHAILSQCRPVVEAVREYKNAIESRSADKAGKAMRQLNLISIPTLPEAK